jgi:hypothetical protein
VIPEKPKFDVGQHSSYCHEDEPEEHFAHCEDSRLVDDLYACSFIHEFEYLVSLDLPIAAGDRPDVLLEIESPLDLANHCHVRLRNHDVGGCFEAEVLEHLLRLCGVHDRGEEDWISFRVDHSLAFIELHHVLELRDELARLLNRYLQSLQLRAVK